MKQNKRISFARLLQISLILVMVMSLLLCGCGKKKESEKPETYKGIFLGDGDGKLEAQDMADGASSLYGQLLSYLSGASGNGNAGGSGMEMNMSVTLGEDLKDTIGMMLAMTGTDVDLDWLNKLEMTYTTAYQGSLMQQLVSAKLNGENILSGEIIADLLNGMMYVGYPELSDSYLGMGMDMGTGEDMNASMEEMQAMLEQMAKYADQMPSEQEVNAAMSHYIAVIIEAMGDPDVSNEKLSYGGVSQNVTAKTYEIRQSDALKIALAVLQAAQNDAQLKALLDDCSKALNQAASEDMAEWEDVDMYAMLQAALPEAIEEIQEELSEVTAEEDRLGVELILYTDGDALVGLTYIQHSYMGSAEEGRPEYDAGVENRATVEYKDYTYEFSCYTLHDGDDSAFVMEVGGDIDGYVTLAGTGTEKNGKLNGEYSLIVEEAEVLTFELVDFNMNALRQGAIVGTVRLYLPEDLMDETGLSSFIYDPVVELVLDIQADKASVGLNLLSDDDLYIGMSMSFKMVSNVQIEVPKDYIEGSEASMMEWFSTLDLDAVLDNLDDAGVPNDLMDMLEDMLQMVG